jgi:hypothetical protein
MLICKNCLYGPIVLILQALHQHLPFSFCFFFLSHVPFSFFLSFFFFFFHSSLCHSLTLSRWWATRGTLSPFYRRDGPLDVPHLARNWRHWWRHDWRNFIFLCEACPFLDPFTLSRFPIDTKFYEHIKVFELIVLLGGTKCFEFIWPHF